MAAILSFNQGTALYGISFIIRALVMFFLVQPNGFYRQADSVDYHNCAVNIAAGNGMHRIDTQDPIFWRTPGYPPYLAFFYNLCGLKSWRFEDNTDAHMLALWMQIILSSFIPIILFYLGYIITQTYAIALALAWISVFHLGMVLATTYLLSEGIALIFFYLFLAFFFHALLYAPSKIPIVIITGAALSLSLYTWMRPMGEFIGVFAILLLCCASGGNWKQKSARGLLFAALFFGSLFPWYLRNHSLTGEWFFCPTIGTYLNCFAVPKILRRTLNKPIEECLKITQTNAGRAVYQKKLRLRGTGKHVSNSVCKEVAYPIVMKHPWFFMYDWFTEIIKTTFDLYSYQFIPMLDDSYWYDPIEEYLPEKISACLWAHQMPWPMRSICWIELLYSIFLWMGLLGGLWVFIIQRCMHAIPVCLFAQSLGKPWIVSCMLIGLIIGMTGGFGYARLRLPAEPLMLILSLTFWYWLSLQSHKDKK